MPPQTLGSNGSLANKYAELSCWCITEAESYLRRRNNIQASEKGWGATAQALKAIAEERGWNHNGHGLIVDIAKQVADEQGRTDIIAWFGTAQSLHVNFYEDSLALDVVKAYMNVVKSLLSEMERIRTEPPPEFTPETRDQRNRRRRLTRERQGFDS